MRDEDQRMITSETVTKRLLPIPYYIETYKNNHTMWMIRKCLKHKVARQIFRKGFIRLCLIRGILWRNAVPEVILQDAGWYGVQELFLALILLTRPASDPILGHSLRSGIFLKKNSAGHNTQNYKSVLFLYACKTWSVGKNIDWGCLRICCGREYLDVRGIKWWEAGDICTLRCSIICTFHKILPHRSIKKG
jgi:hypothetical protein